MRKRAVWPSDGCHLIREGCIGPKAAGCSPPVERVTALFLRFLPRILVPAVWQIHPLLTTRWIPRHRVPAAFAQLLDADLLDADHPSRRSRLRLALRSI